jgi:TatD DNase family protein
MSLRLYDAHNHLHDERLAPHRGEIVATVERSGIVRMVVNGACESDWPEVLALARAHSWVLPSFGYHPWHVAARTPEWRERLVEFLDAVPSAIGEIGLDRWKPGLDYAGQEAVFLWQLRLAAERNLPASIHCLQAWGRLFDLLREGPRPARGFLLHSYGGPAEMIAPLAKLGAYFSLPGYFAHARKVRQRETFKLVPRGRLLIETDAPDQSLPESRVRFPLSSDSHGKAVNHPANLAAVYEFAADLRGEKIERLAPQVEENFRTLFGR